MNHADDPQICLGDYAYWRTANGWCGGEAAEEFGGEAWWMGGSVTDEQLIHALDHIEQLLAALAVKEGHDHFDCTAERAQCFLRIQQLEAERDDARQNMHHYKKHLASVEAELARCYYFARVVAGHAEDIKAEATCMLHPELAEERARWADVVKDGSIAYADGHGPDDPPRPVQRHE